MSAARYAPCPWYPEYGTLAAGAARGRAVADATSTVAWPSSSPPPSPPALTRMVTTSAAVIDTRAPRWTTGTASVVVHTRMASTEHPLLQQSSSSLTEHRRYPLPNVAQWDAAAA